MLESRIERRAVDELEAIGCLCIKVGFAGWPDRLIVYAPERVVWLEFKQPTGRLGPKQKIRIEELEDRGHKVFVVTSHEEAISVIKAERRAIGYPEDGNLRDPQAPENHHLGKARHGKNGHSFNSS